MKRQFLKFISILMTIAIIMLLLPSVSAIVVNKRGASTAVNTNVLGDVDGDGILAIADATLLQKHLAMVEKLSEQAFKLADIDQNGTVAIDDVTTIQKILAMLLPPPTPATPATPDTPNITVPYYWRLNLTKAADDINTAMENSGQVKSSFLFYTDSHYDSGAKMAPTLLKWLSQSTGINKTFFGGDIVQTESDNPEDMSYLWDWRKDLEGLPNHYSVVGNHDDGNEVNNRFSEEYIYSFLQAPEANDAIVRDTSGLYYYIDDETEYTRYLCLDTAYQGATSQQIAFVENALITTPAGWNIIAVSHIWYDNDYSTNPPIITELSGQGSTFVSMFDSYNMREGIFAYGDGMVKLCIGGHCHRDFYAESDTGIPIVLAQTEGFNTRDEKAYAGTISESSVSAIVADFDQNIVHIIRAGRGESKEIKINHRTTSAATNILPIAAELDGSIYNANGTPGYKQNTRWSGSSNAEQTQIGTYLTGWWELSRASDIYYLKNFNITDSTQISVIGYDPVTQKTSANGGALFEYYCTPIWDIKTGKLVGFSSNVVGTLFRFEIKNGATIGEDPVVTKGKILY
ncbi:MAG: hypothetical protein LBM65_03495 [Oscillospiraceae bacterium]|jgi:hypothetical protein|nr:hypothetical protein [Oscillospiraceae bacterium]